MGFAQWINDMRWAMNAKRARAWRRKLMQLIRNEIIEECAKVADAARESAKEHHGVEASIGADIAARRIRALAIPSQNGATHD
jgi:hypothetical protein